MRISREDIANGGIIPRWYAVAYRLDYNDVVVCYPVGIHLVVMAWEWLHWKVSHGKDYSLMRAPIRQAYHAGVRDTLEQCRDETVKQIVREAMEAMQKEGRP